MSKGQLSWDDILKAANAKSEKTDASSDAASESTSDVISDVTSGAADGVERSNETVASKVASKIESPEQAITELDAFLGEKPPVKRTRATKKKSNTEPKKKTEFAQKDWSKLEFDTPGDGELTKTTVVESAKSTGALVKKNSTVSEPKIEIPTAEMVRKNEPQILTVSEINKFVRDTLEGKFSTLWLKAEISNFKAHSSGHFYFSLKDMKSQIGAMMFRGANSSLKFRPEDGMEVLVRGRVTVFEPRGTYSILVETMEPVGAGALQKAYEQLKAKLQKEGLFDASRKRALPSLPKHIAIVTSPTGAAIRDMLNVLGRRFKGAHITVIPCKVQGDQAPGEIVQAIQLANRLLDVDVMIVGRGGGSIEDLWAFNDERVARAIATARVPVISAVGHEVDFTIADFVADLRAPTPSAAAELVVKNAADLANRIADLQRALKLRMANRLSQAKQSTLAISKRLVGPQRRVQDAMIRCDELMQRLQLSTLRAFQDRRMHVSLLRQKLGSPIPKIHRQSDFVKQLDGRMKLSMRTQMARRHEVVRRQMAVLDSLSPLKVLDRGYSMVMKDEHVVSDVQNLKVGDKVEVRMAEGTFGAQVTTVSSNKE